MLDFGYLIAAFVVFIIVYIGNNYIVQSLKGFSKVSKKIVETILLSIFTITLEVIINDFIPSSHFYVFLAIIIIVLFFEPLYVSLIVLSISLIFYLPYYGFSDNIYFIEVIILLPIFLRFFCDLLNFKKKYYIPFLLILNSVLYFLFLSFLENGQTVFSVNSFLPVLYVAILAILNILIRQSIYNVIESANNLYHASLFAIPGYYRQAKSDERFLRFVEENRFENGVLGLVNFKIKAKTEKLINERDFQTSKAKMLNQLRLLLTRHKVLYFEANEKHFGFFLPIDLLKNINTNYYQHQWFLNLKNILDDFAFDSDTSSEFKLEPYFAFSIYGIESADFARLVSNCEFTFASKNALKNERYLFFNPQEYQEKIMDGTQLAKLNQIVNLKNMFPVFFNIVNVQNQATDLYYIEPALDTLISEENKIKKLIFSSGLWETFLRYIAARALKIYNNSNVSKNIPLGICYPLSFLASPFFKVDNFLLNLQAEKIEANKIIIFFDCNFYNQLKNKKIFWKNIDKVRKNNINFGINNFGLDTMDLKFVQKLAPVYLNLSENFFLAKMKEINLANVLNLYLQVAKKLNAKLIYSKTLNVAELSELIKKKVNLLGGSIFDNYAYVPQELSNQNKFYIQDILKEINNE